MLENRGTAFFRPIDLQGGQLENINVAVDATEREKEKIRPSPAHGRHAVRMDQRDLYRVKRGWKGRTEWLFSRKLPCPEPPCSSTSLLSGRDDEERASGTESVLSQGGESAGIRAWLPTTNFQISPQRLEASGRLLRPFIHFNLDVRSRWAGLFVFVVVD